MGEQLKWKVTPDGMVAVYAGRRLRYARWQKLFMCWSGKRYLGTERSERKAQDRCMTGISTELVKEGRRLGLV